MFFLDWLVCARVCARARVHFCSCVTLRERVKIRGRTSVFSRGCAVNKSNEFISGYAHLLYESPRWKPG
jgi:hypothetical protein